MAKRKAVAVVEQDKVEVQLPEMEVVIEDFVETGQYPIEKASTSEPEVDLKTAVNGTSEDRLKSSPCQACGKSTTQLPADGMNPSGETPSRTYQGE